MSRYASSRWSEFADDPYPSIREALAPEYADLSPDAIESMVESMYDDISAEDLENFFNTLKKVGSTVGKAATKALPGVISGATAGAALGPWGALAGGVAGGAISLAGQSGGGGGRRRGRGGRRGGKGGRRRLGGALQTAGRVATQVAGSPAAAQFLRTVARPQVVQGLMSASLGGAGKGQVNVGGVSVPTGAITNLLGRLLDRAEVEIHENMASLASGTPPYLLDDDGEFIVDPTDADARADLLLELFAEADEHAHEREQVRAFDFSESDDDWAEDEYHESYDEEDELSDDEIAIELEEAYLAVVED